MDDPSNENISVSDTKSILATGGYDHTVKLWQAHSSVCYWTGQHADSQVNALSVTPDGQRIASAGYQHIRMYDLNSTNSNPILNYENISKNVTSVGFQEDGRWMYTTGEDTNARIWDLRSRNLHCNRIFQANAAINFAVLHPNQVDLIICDDNGIIHVWNVKNDRNEQLIPEQEATIQCVAVDSNGTFLAAVNNMGHCHIWSLSHDSQSGGVQFKPKHKILAHGRQVLSCKFSPDSSFLVTTSADQSARVWKTQDFSLYREMKISSGQRWVWDAAFTNDSQYLITASSDGLARLWCIETGEVEREYSGHQKAVTALAFMDSTASF